MRTFTHGRPRDEAGRERERALVLKIVDRLLKLKAATDPEQGIASARNKDINAFRALKNTQELVDLLAGWAVAHQVGLALEGRSFVPLGPASTRKLPTYIEALAAVDDHRHEIAGSKFDDANDAQAGRRILINLLHSNPGALPEGIARRAVDGLQALDLGKTKPLFQKARRRPKVSSEELELHFRALEFVAYRSGLGKAIGKATIKVAEAFNVSPETLMSWEKRLRGRFGGLVVSQRKTFARNAGTSVEAGIAPEHAAVHDAQYGDDAMQAAATAYHNLKRAQKTRKKQ